MVIGTLLAVLRDLPIPQWDTDTDLSIIYPGDEELQAMLDRFPKILAQEGKRRGYGTPHNTRSAHALIILRMCLNRYI
jgi:hypothetical protein